MQGLEGRVAVVTGGGSGIGRAVCQRFAQEGCKVAIFDVNEAAGQETVDLVKDSGGAALFQKVDITSYDDVDTGVSAVETELGPVDILVNNAGWDAIVPFLNTDFDLWKKVIDINLYGPLHLHYRILPGMAERKQGKVVNVASDAGRVGSSGEAVYSAAKGGIVAFTKTVARELARSNVQLNTVCPGPTDTPLFDEILGGGEQGQKIADGLQRAIPMKRLGQPDDYPGVIAFLASDDANFITGQTISVSGGLTMHG